MTDVKEKPEMNAITQRQAQPDPMVGLLEKVLSNPDLPIDRLEKMLELKERHDKGLREERAEESRRAFNAAMAKAQRAMPTVIKSKTNKHTRSTYADLSDVVEQAMPVVYGHGFSVSFTPAGADDKSNLLIDWCVMHEAGHTQTGQAGFPLDAAGAQGNANKTGIQAMGSTMSYARRYLICNLFNIATDDDDDGNQTAFVSEDQAKTLRKMIETAGVAEKIVLDAHGAPSIDKFPAQEFNTAVERLRIDISKREKANGTAN